MKQFNRLVVTDFRNVKTMLFSILGVFFVAHLGLIYFLGRLSISVMFPWFTAINGLSLAAALIISISLSFIIWSDEWKGHHQLLLFPLPVSRVSIFLSKFVVIFVSFLLIFGTLGIFFTVEGMVQPQLPSLGNIWEAPFAQIMAQLISTIVLILLAFFSFLLGKAIKRFSKMITFLTFILLLNMPSIITFLIHKTGEITSVNMSPGMVIINGEPLTVLPITLNLVLGTLYVLGSMYLLNRKIEV